MASGAEWIGVWSVIIAVLLKSEGTVSEENGDVREDFPVQDAFDVLAPFAMGSTDQAQGWLVELPFLLSLSECFYFSINFCCWLVSFFALLLNCSVIYGTLRRVAFNS